MRYLERKPGHLWWMKSPRKFMYFVRECSAFLILIWLIGPVLDGILFKPLSINAINIVNYIGLTGAIIHSITWLAALPKIFPFRLNKTQQILAYFLLLIIVISITLLSNYLIFEELLFKI